MDRFTDLKRSGISAFTALNLLSDEVITVSGNWSPAFPTTTKAISVQLIGSSGGGAGGNTAALLANSYGGQGSAPGWVVEREYAITDVPFPIACTIGAGGGGGLVNAPGTDGGITRFGTLVAAPGGKGAPTGATVVTTVLDGQSRASVAGGTSTATPGYSPDRGGPGSGAGGGGGTATAGAAGGGGNGGAFVNAVSTGGGGTAGTAGSPRSRPFFGDGGGSGFNASAAGDGGAPGGGAGGGGGALSTGGKGGAGARGEIRIRCWG